jgi:hypothetical protein
MNRRNFFRLLGGSAAIAALPNIVRAQTLGLGGTAASERITVGIIGCGGIHNGHREFVLNDPSLQLTWLCDVDEKHLSQSLKHSEDAYAQRDGTPSHKGIRSTRDFREVLADPGLDVVFVCTPDHWHALPVIAAANAGKHIYVEKPLSRTAAEGEAMVEAVRRSGVICQVGSQQRSSGEFIRAVGLARNGFLGRIHRVQVGLPGGGGVQNQVTPQPQSIPPELDYDFWVGPSPLLPYVSERVHFHWRWRYEFAGGQLTDWINHHYDIAQVALGVNEQIPVAIRRASAQFHTNPIYNTATRYAFDAHFATGEVIEVSSDFAMGIRLEGEHGWVYVNRDLIEFSSPTLRSAPLPSQGFTLSNASGGQTEHRRNFFECVRKRTVPRSPIDQAHKTAMSAHLANAAIRSGRSELKFDPAKNRIVAAPDADRFLSPNYRAPWHLPV